MLAVALAFLLAAPAHAQLPPPVAGETVNLEPVDGTVTTKCKGEDDYTELTEPTQVEVGCTVDATDGTVRLTSATGVGDETDTGEFWGGRFKIVFTAGSGATVLVLAGSVMSSEDEDGTQGNQVWGKSQGNFTTEGDRGAATTRGTTWLVVDLPDGGTKVTVKKGTVSFEDFVLGITVTVKAGESYTAGGAVTPVSSVSAYTNADNVFATGQGGAETSVGGGALPFTGLDLGFLIGGGLLLVAVGAAMTRYVPRTNRS
jgi:hypothetical protein